MNFFSELFPIIRLLRHSLPKNVNILFVSAFRTSFIEEDLRFLSKHFQVQPRIGHGILHLLKIILSLFQTDIIFCWFASVYSAVGVIIGKYLGVKSVLILGGVDVAADEELGYGIWLSKWKSKLVRRALLLADRVLVVDNSLKEEAMQRAGYDGNNIVYLPTGYDALFWKPLIEKKKIVLTVASCSDEIRLRIKGIDVLIQAAQRMPNAEFVVVGTESDLAYRLQPPMNMTFYPSVKKERLLQWYQEAKVYCQPSRREGLPNALCEAMLCGCIPVGTRVGGNATAIADTGFLVPTNDVDALVSGLNYALESGTELPVKARSRIVALFPKEKREADLFSLIEKLLHEAAD
ncbi:MAG: glycosyltransferase family 4 protein [Ignavibacteriae bacterium]|nr:glycosyltransferase family 4 protein [Ignavibacteriota bacterium]